MLDNKTIDFIEKYKEEDVHILLLSSHRYKDIDINQAVTIIECRKKLKNKVPEWVSNNRLVYKSKVSAEQSSSSVTARYKQKYCKNGTIIDLTGGLGVDTYFLSQANRFVVYVEKNRELFEASLHNFKELGADNIVGINCETNAENISKIMSFAYKRTSANHIDMIYTDPSRRDAEGERVLSVNSYEPDITKIIDILIDLADKVVVKLSPMVDIKSVINQFNSLFSIDILSIENDCKELLLLFKKERDNKGVQITAVNYSKSRGYEEFAFNLEEENSCKSIFADASLGRYLYEPNSSIYKSGAFKIAGERYKLRKLDTNTHLYTSHSLENNFPGRVFKIKEVVNYNKDAIRNLRKIYPKANIATRNFPLKAEDLRKKLSLLEGGNLTIFGCTLISGSKVLVICSREI